ncbi:MAG: AbrB/MazE/SpoVT family DNA-binding domain-containing protein [Clostridia bacterium]|nr:AbrB/MazE/SpoVT family DNA-binding domain-containing protein [Clostridia bacterium]
MKATGIVRRIDDLGRVVIPKEIRRTMRIREGDPLEIFTDREGEVIFKKYSPIGELASFAAQYVDTLHKICSMSVVVTDRDTVIACAGVSKKEYNDKKLTPEFEALMEKRSLYTYSTQQIMICDGASSYVKYAMPIISEGDIVGCIACVSSEQAPTIDPHSTEAKLIQTASSFLGRQFES